MELFLISGSFVILLTFVMIAWVLRTQDDAPRRVEAKNPYKVTVYLYNERPIIRYFDEDDNVWPYTTARLFAKDFASTVRREGIEQFGNHYPVHRIKEIEVRENKENVI